MQARRVKGRFTTTLGGFFVTGVLLYGGGVDREAGAQTGKAELDRRSISQGVGQPPIQASRHASPKALLNPMPGRVAKPQPHNSVPKITSLPRDQSIPGYAYLYQPLAVDADGDKLVWTLPEAPAGMMIEPDSGLLAAQSLPPGQHTVSLRVDDGNGGSDTQQFTIDIKAGPVILSTPPHFTYTGTPYLYHVHAFEPSGLPLQYNIAAGPAGLHIDPESGLLEWTTGAAGEFEIGVRVSNPYGHLDTQSFRLTVMDPDAVRIVSEPVTEAFVSVTYEYPLSLLNAPGAGASYYFNQAPPGMTVDSGTGLVNWVPATTGATAVEIVATNDRGSMHTQRFTIGVNSLEQTDKMFGDILDSLFTSLIKRDLATAMQLLTEDARLRLGPLLIELLDVMDQVAANYTAPVRISIDPDLAEYMVRRTGGSGDRVFMVTFLRTNNGEWRIHDL